VLSFDRLTNVAFSFTNHDETSPHLKLKDPSIPIAVNLPEYAEPAQRYCPAGVYEVLGEDAEGRPSRSTSRTASTARPATSRTRRRTSTGPRRMGGGGPNYPNMC
jgi:electron-transferring-flavoprotein dehydrogenase